MVLLSEQERLYAVELKLLDDAANHDLTTTSDWTTMRTTTFTLSKSLIIMLKASVLAHQDGTSGHSVHGAGQITVDGVPVWTSGGIEATNPDSDFYQTSPDIYILLAAGSHTVNFQLACWQISSSSCRITVCNMYVGQLNFNDKLSGGPWDSGSVAIAAWGTQTLINQNVTIPAGRTTPVGQILGYSALIYVVATDSLGRVTHMKNVGESDDGSKLNVKLYINSAQVSFKGRANDDADGNGSISAYGHGADGYYYAFLPVNQTLNIQVTAYNNYGSGCNAEAYVFVLLCPWILLPLGTDYAVVSLAFSQGSTFYAYLEPLYVDTSKSSKIGMKRFKSLGDSTDYYSIASGTGILQHSYTLDIVDVPSAVWNVNPATDTVCISYVAVDAK